LPVSQSPPLPLRVALIAAAAAAGWLAWWLAGWVVEGSLLGDAALVLQACAVFVALTLCERLYDRIAGPSGH